MHTEERQHMAIDIERISPKCKACQPKFFMPFFHLFILPAPKGFHWLFYLYAEFINLWVFC